MSKEVDQVRVMLYKGRKRLFNKAVSWWTRGPYSHVEIVMPNGLSYSSSYMDGGVRGKYIDFDEHIWDCVFVNVGDFNRIIGKIGDAFGRPYDVRGVFGFVIRRVKESRKKMFCSEFVMHVLGFDEPWRFDPNTCATTLRRVGKCLDR